MSLALRPRTLLLFAGDLFFLTLSLWVSLYLRSFQPPSADLFLAHVYPFSMLFVVWVFVYFVAGLYENRSVILARRAISAALLISQIINLAIAAVFFSFIPIFLVAPKTVLLIYLAVSFLLGLLWRVVIFPQLTRPEKALLLGAGEEANELLNALTHARYAPTHVVAIVAPGPGLPERIITAMENHQARIIIADLNNPEVLQAFPALLKLLSAGVRFFDLSALYEEIFERIPFSRLDDRWLARNVSRYAHTFYDAIKRAIDLAVAIPAGLVSLLLYPFIALAIRLDDGGPVFIAQRRVGQDNRIIHIHKFRSMRRNDMELSVQAKDNPITRVGRFLRVSRLDELPQLWDVVRGELSLIGPRPELPSGVALYEKEIPFYRARHLIKPGLSGWAQLYHDNHPHHGADIEATREKLSYDLYYLKHRSLLLDITVILKTVKKLLSQSGV